MPLKKMWRWRDSLVIWYNLHSGNKFRDLEKDGFGKRFIIKDVPENYHGTKITNVQTV